MDHQIFTNICTGFSSSLVHTRTSSSPSRIMSRNNQDNSFQESRLPKGAAVTAALLVVLAAGLVLIIQGLR